MVPTLSSNPQDAIRVAIVEDDRTTRDGLALLIGSTPGYCCVGAYRSLEESLRQLAAAAPNVVLLDIDLPGRPGSEGVPDILERCPGAVVLMLTVFDGQQHVFESICSGACGYLLKKTPPARLLEAIREVHEGGAPMSPEIARRVIRALGDTAPPVVAERLTPQETRLLALLAEGHSYRAAGEHLDITINTVRNHIRSIYEKLHVHSRSQAIAKALKGRLI